MVRQRINKRLGLAHGRVERLKGCRDTMKMVCAQLRGRYRSRAASGADKAELASIRQELAEREGQVERYARRLIRARKIELLLCGEARGSAPTVIVPTASVDFHAALDELVKARMGHAAPQLRTVAQTRAVKHTLRGVDDEGFEIDVHVLRTPDLSVVARLVREEADFAPEHQAAADEFARLGDLAHAGLPMAKMRFSDSPGRAFIGPEGREDLERRWKACVAVLRAYEFRVLDGVLRHGQSLEKAGQSVCAATSLHGRRERAKGYLLTGLEALVDHWGMRAGQGARKSA